jgi:hypothetical protein
MHVIKIARQIKATKQPLTVSGGKKQQFTRYIREALRTQMVMVLVI